MNKLKENFHILRVDVNMNLMTPTKIEHNLKVPQKLEMPYFLKNKYHFQKLKMVKIATFYIINAIVAATIQRTETFHDTICSPKYVLSSL